MDIDKVQVVASRIEDGEEYNWNWMSYGGEGSGIKTSILTDK